LPAKALAKTGKQEINTPLFQAAQKNDISKNISHLVSLCIYSYFLKA